LLIGVFVLVLSIFLPGGPSCGAGEVRPQCDPEEYLEIMHLAELRLTPEDREISERLRQRADPNGDITDREYVAARAYLNAVSLECRRAGHRSIDALLAAYGGSQ